MKSINIIVAALMLATVASPALGNDSTAALTNGGLVLTKNAAASAYGHHVNGEFRP